MDVINRATCRAIENEVELTLKVLADRLGLTVKVGGGRFDPMLGTFSPKVEFALGVVNGKDRDQRAFENTLAQIGFLFPGILPEHYGTSWVSGGHTFTLRALNQKKLPVVVENEEGKRYMTTLDRLQRVLCVGPYASGLSRKQ